jgi:hypothetical protein
MAELSLGTMVSICVFQESVFSSVSPRNVVVSGSLWEVLFSHRIIKRDTMSTALLPKSLVISFSLTLQRRHLYVV